MEFDLEKLKNNKTKIVFTCKVVTPMFLSGVNTQNAELREASFKGVLRFWWRRT